jgi:hypothetical protein
MTQLGASVESVAGDNEELILFELPLHIPLEIGKPHFIELENGEKHEIAFTLILGNNNHVIVGFKFVPSA